MYVCMHKGTNDISYSQIACEIPFVKGLSLVRVIISASIPVADSSVPTPVLVDQYEHRHYCMVNMTNLWTQPCSTLSGALLTK